MTEATKTVDVTRAEFEALRREVARNAADIARHDTQYAVINTKLTAILWLLGTLGAAFAAAAVRAICGGAL